MRRGSPLIQILKVMDSKVLIEGRRNNAEAGNHKSKLVRDDTIINFIKTSIQLWHF